MADIAKSPTTRSPIPSQDQRGRIDDARAVDETLVAAVGDGDRTAFAELYDKHVRRAYSLARRVCVSAELAEDVVQEVFVAFWRAPEKFDARRGSFGTWLLTMVHHRAVDAVRREGAHRRKADAVADPAATAAPMVAAGADVDALAGVEAKAVREALGSLPEDQQRMISLAYFGGHTQNEVATITGVPLGTVKSRTFAGLRKLRGLLASLRLADDWSGEGR